METTRFGWIGEARRAAIFEILSALIEDWANAWWCGYANGQLAVTAAGEMDAQSRLQGAYISHAVTGSVAIHVGTRGPDAVARHLAATMTDDDLDLAMKIGEQALGDLAMSIHGRAGSLAAAAPVKTSLPQSLLEDRLGAFAITATLGRLPVMLIIDRQLGERLVPPGAPKADKPLHTRHAALSRATLRVNAVMDFGHVDLAHLSDLSVGEVLIGDQKLEEPLHIHVEGKGAVATGFMRRIGEKRAIVIDGAMTQEPYRHD